jgi:signal transduction histidine kinase
MQEREIERAAPLDAEDFVMESEERQKRLRWILLGTFAAMLLLMTLAGLESLRSLRELNEVSREVSQRYSAHNQGLQAVLVSFRVYDEQMEEYLLSDVIVTNIPDPAKVASRGAAVHAALQRYPQDCSGEERALLWQFDQAVSTEETAFAGTKNWNARERKRHGYVFVQEKLMPIRAQVWELASAVSRANHERLMAENQSVADQFLGLQSRVSRMVGVTLFAGIVLSLAAGYYILRLEQSGRKRYVALAQSREELEGLSRRLVEAQEAERRAISRELHDEVGQSLGAVLVDLGQLANLVPPEDTMVREQIARIKKAAESAVRAIRDMALLLRPPMLDDLGLIPAPEWQARETSRRSDMEVEVHAAELPGNLPDRVKIGIYRLVQEALQNAATHAHAKNAKVVVRYDPDKVEVEVSDDGVGFQPERTRGMGILGMEERVRQLGGALQLRSAPGKGTTVHAVLPVDAKDSH